MMLSRNVHGDRRIFYTSTIHHQFRTLAFYHPVCHPKKPSKTIPHRGFSWFFHGFSWCSPWKQLDVENLTIFQTAFPTSQVKSVAQPKPGAPPRISSMEKMHVCIEKTSFYIQYIVIYIYNIDFILISYYITVSHHGSLVWNYMKIKKAYQSKLNAQTLRRAVRRENLVRLMKKKPMAVVQHGLDMIGLRDNVLPIVGVLFF